MKLPRVASLLPAATESISRLGGIEQLVAISHECDFPAEVESLPKITKTRRSIEGTSREIDQTIQELIAESLSIYEINIEELRRLSPDVIVTQDLCDVCAVSKSDLCQALESIVNHKVEIVTLHPKKLDDIWNDIREISRAIGREKKVDPLLQELRTRFERIRSRTKEQNRSQKILTIEWLDPLMLGGLWMSELVEIAGGVSLGPGKGEKSVPLKDEEAQFLGPDVVLVKPCGFPLAQTRKEISRIKSLISPSCPAVRSNRLYLADGNAYFNRSGPRIVDSAEILAAILHPSIFAREAAMYDRSYERLPL